ncbi:MAG: hypothetical protein WDO14_06655 [Bacteroidota bacterium]
MILPWFYLLIALQGFCLYHAYQHRTDQKWYYLIIFIPYIGCFIYLYDAFYTRRSVTEVSEVLKQVVNSNYKIDQLEKDALFNDSATNNIRLADAYIEAGRYAEAVDLYNTCRVGFLADDESLQRKLLRALYLNNEFDKVEALGSELANTKAFKNSEERIGLAWALHKLGKTEQARQHFEDMNRTFTNYASRQAYCEFLIATNDLTAAKALASELAHEFTMMKAPERRIHRDVIRQVADLQQSLGK